MERVKLPRRAAPRHPTSLEFFGRLKWIDGRPLMSTIEPYRRAVFTAVLDTRRPDGVPVYNLALLGRAKKNNKTTDLVLCLPLPLDDQRRAPGQ
jgi:hypothetical protein